MDTLDRKPGRIAPDVLPHLAGPHRASVSMEVAMKVAGHKTDSVHRRYAIVSDADLRDAAVRLSTLTGTLAANGRNGVGEVRDGIAQSR